MPLADIEMIEPRRHAFDIDAIYFRRQPLLSDEGFTAITYAFDAPRLTFSDYAFDAATPAAAAAD